MPARLPFSRRSRRSLSMTRPSRATGGALDARRRRRVRDGLALCFALGAVSLTVGCGDTASTETGREDVDAEPVDSRPAFYSTLDRLPVDFNTAATIVGSGWIGAELVGSELNVEGHFEGLVSPATEVQVHRARPGLRGPAVAGLELVVEGDGRTGSVQGSLSLDASLEQALRAGELYVQLASEGNPDGVLRGWLLSSR